LFPTDEKWLVGVLNSKLAWFFFTDICVVRSGGYVEMKPQYFEQFPVAIPKNKEEFTTIVENISDLHSELNHEKHGFVHYVESKYKPKKVSKKIEEFYTLDFADFLKELKKQKVELDAKEEAKLLTYFEEEKEKILKLQSEIDKTDNEIDQLVYKLYNLTPAEITLIEQSLK